MYLRNNEALAMVSLLHRAKRGEVARDEVA
jgi:hypothetical protein